MKNFLFCLILILSALDINAAKRALLIGISNYPTNHYSPDASWTSIHGANDAVLLNQTLKKQGFKVTTLTNSEATASQIRLSMKSLIQSIKKGDVVYVHFSGHGQPVEDYSGDEVDGWDESIVPYDAMQMYIKGKYEGSNHILDDELNGYIESMRAKAGSKGMIYIVIDACHSGSSFRGDDEDDDVPVRGTMRGFSSSRKEYVPRIDKRSKIRISHDDNKADVCVVEACRSYQTNSEIKQDGKFYGPLSYYTNKVLMSAALSHDVSWTEKVKHLMDKDNRLIRQNVVIETSK